jgi:signal peptidase I
MLKNPKVFAIRGRGNSMQPFFTNSAILILNSDINHPALKFGDIICFKHNKKLTVHRIIETSTNKFLVKGDGLSYSDGWIKKNEIIARVSAVKSSNSIYSLKTKRGILVNTIMAHFSKATLKFPYLKLFVVRNIFLLKSIRFLVKKILL